MRTNSRRMIVLAAFAILVREIPIRAQTPATTSPIGAPMFAGVTGDGVGVSFSWWAVKGAIAYELVRAPDPRQTPITIATLPGTTLGYRDPQVGNGPEYFQLVAIGAG